MHSIETTILGDYSTLSLISKFKILHRALYINAEVVTHSSKATWCTSRCRHWSLSLMRCISKNILSIAALSLGTSWNQRISNWCSHAWWDQLVWWVARVSYLVVACTPCLWISLCRALRWPFMILENWTCSNDGSTVWISCSITSMINLRDTSTMYVLMIYKCSRVWSINTVRAYVSRVLVIIHCRSWGNLAIGCILNRVSCRWQNIRWSDWRNTVTFRHVLTGSSILLESLMLRRSLILHELLLFSKRGSRWSLKIVPLSSLDLIWQWVIPIVISLCFKHLIIGGTVGLYFIALATSSCCNCFDIDFGCAHISHWHISLNVIDVYIVDPVVEISHIQGQAVVVNELDIVHLLVDKLITTAFWRHLLPTVIGLIMANVTWRLTSTIGTLVLLGIPTCLTIKIFKIVHIYKGKSKINNYKFK